MSVSLPMFGTFERNELYKFIRLGLLFSLIIGAYWALGVIKQSIFSQVVGSAMQPYARIVSMIGMVPLLMLYSKLLDYFSYEKVFYILSSFYMIGTIFFSFLQLNCSAASPEFCFSHLLAYLFAVFCDSYTLIIALFWAIVTDSTLADSAKKGFSLIVALGQIGGIVLPFTITQLPVLFELKTNFLSVFLCAIPVAGTMLALHRFLRKTPTALLQSYRGINELELQKEREQPGFFEGLYLVSEHWYLIGIFCVAVVPDILATIFDLHFLLLAEQHYPGVALTSYFGKYGSTVNAVTLLFLLTGINNITRLFGVSIALLIMPLVFAAALCGFVLLDSLNFLFGLMVSIKSINYALSVPAMKQLYIPTTHDTRFKAQAWIGSFSPHASKLSGSLFNMSLSPLQTMLGVVAGRARHVIMGSYFGFVLVIIWTCIAYSLGKTHKQAIEQNKVVC